MADSDYRDDDRDDRDRDDDRPRRRDRDDRPPPKKGGGLKVLLISLGVVLFLCVGGCSVGGYFYYQWIAGMMKQPEDFLAKVKAGDYAGAYNSTSAGYKARYTQQQFTDAMKGAKLDQNTGLAGPLGSKSGGGSRGPSLIATVAVPGGTTDVTFDLVQEGGAFTFVIGDITGMDINYTGTRVGFPK